MILKPNEAKELVTDFVHDKLQLCVKEKVLNFGDPDKARIQIAGKNFASFDMVILKQNNYHDMFKLCSHRFIDVGAMFYPIFGYVPNTDQLCDYFKLNKTNHRALDDAKTVVELINIAAKPYLEGTVSKKCPIYKPYLSIDLETTGLTDVNPYILEFGAVFADFGYFDLPKKDSELSFLIDNGELDPKRCGQVAMDMNKQILETIAKARK